MVSPSSFRKNEEAHHPSALHKSATYTSLQITRSQGDIRNMAQLFLSLLAFVVSLASNVSANSIGTGSCAAGIASVGGTHLDYGPNSVSMREGGAFSLTDALVVVSINGMTLTPGVAATFESGVDLTWSVSSPQVTYKGIFVRVQAADDNIFTHMGVGTLLANAALCDTLAENVIGVNHNSATPKGDNSGVMNFEGSGSVTMDVTIVFDNVVSSVYASSSFPLTIGGGTPVAPSPVADTTPSPAGDPTPVTAPIPTAPVAPTAPATVPIPTASVTPTAPTPTAPVTPTAPTADGECPDDGKGKGKGGESGKGKGGKGMMKCKGGMMMGMETKSPKSPKTPKSEEGKGKGSEGKGKGDARRFLK